jgi:hypothetical protein
VSAPVHVTTHSADSLALLTSSTKGRANIEAITRAIGNRVQELEDAIWAAIQAVQLANTPTGVWLDALGEIAGEPRHARGDADYLLAVKVALRANRSQGTAEDIIQILALLGVSFTYSEDPNAPLEFRVDVYGIPGGGPSVVSPMHRAKMGGSRALYASSPATRALSFVFNEASLGDAVTSTGPLLGSLIEA